MTTPNTIRTTHVSYPFRLRDPLNGRWMKARFLAKINEIADCCAAWEIVAPARTHPKPH